MCVCVRVCVLFDHLQYAKMEHNQELDGGRGWERG